MKQSLNRTGFSEHQHDVATVSSAEASDTAEGKSLNNNNNNNHHHHSHNNNKIIENNCTRSWGLDLAAPVLRGFGVWYF